MKNWLSHIDTDRFSIFKIISTMVKKCLFMNLFGSSLLMNSRSSVPKIFFSHGEEMVVYKFIGLSQSDAF